MALAVGAAAPAAGDAGSAAALTARQLAGQMVIYSYPGRTPPPTLLAKIRAGEAAGVIFFERNIASVGQLRAVAHQLQDAAAQSPVKKPLLLMVDQEGGMVRRLPGAPSLSQKQIGASANPVGAASAAGRGAGLNLKGAGVNVNLAPVLDVYRTPGGLLDHWQRSYGPNPRTAGQLGAAFIRAMQATGVAATAKHFPGLGTATLAQNTDRRPVTLRVPLASLRAVDELPYRAAIAAGTGLVMVSWARYPALDGRRPAGLSPVIVTGELRRRLGYRGVTVTDALGAGALRAFGGTRNRAVLAVKAGMDLVLCGDKHVREGEDAVDGIAAALAHGQLSARAVRAAVARIEALRATVG